MIFLMVSMMADGCLEIGLLDEARENPGEGM